MNNCVHQWIYIGSKRQDVWRCIFCDEYKINDATQKREWVGLTDADIKEFLPSAYRKPPVKIPPGWEQMIHGLEARLKEKNK